jgi:superfamily II DNA or RNA helicase
MTITHNLRLAEVPDELGRRLTRELTFINPKWRENARMGRWNRQTPRELRFYDRIRGRGLWIPRGWARRVIQICRDLSIPYEIDDRRRSLPPVAFTFKGALRSFQHEAAAAMLARDFGTLSSPTGSGKTVMALYMVAQRRQPTMICVHTRELAQQWVESVQTFLGIPAEEVGFIGGGQRKPGQRITVALVQSLFRCAEAFAPRIGHLVVDECHRTPSRTFTEAVEQFDSRFMLGLTATPWRRDKLEKLIFWYLGDMHHEVDHKRLRLSGAVLGAEVVVRQTTFRSRHDPVAEYSKMLAELTRDDERNRLIAKDIAHESVYGQGACLVLSDRKAHCATLQALLRFKHRVSAELLTGDCRMRDRRAVLEKIRRGRVRVLIATGQLVGEGFDCGNLSTLFLATPIRFSGRLVQYLGRVLRPAPGKSQARIFDYVDVHVAPLRKAARARQAVYCR